MLQRDLSRLEEWVDLGCLVQVTALSISGGFGRTACAVVGRLLERGLVHVVASDAHDPQHRHARLDEACAIVRSRYGEDAGGRPVHAESTNHLERRPTGRGKTDPPGYGGQTLVAVLARRGLEYDFKYALSQMQNRSCASLAPGRPGVSTSRCIVGYRPYRCHECSHRFLSFRYSLPEPDAPPVLGAEKEIAATRGSLRRKQKRREFLLYGSALTVFVVILYFLTREPSIGN